MTDIASDLCSRYIADTLHALATTSRYEEVLHLVVDRIHRLTHCQTCAIALINPKTEYLQIDNYHGLSLSFCNEFRRRIAARAIGRLLWTGTPIVITGRESDRSLAEEVTLERPFVSCACVQIAVHQTTLGYLHVDSVEEDAFGEQQLQMLKIFADIAGCAITKSRLFDENLRLERVDRETGLEKYPPFREKLEAALVRGEELGEHSSVLLLDVDNFKDIVNTYGYDASRQMLRELGDRVKAMLRPIDCGGRYGFDEIAVLIENTDLMDALVSASRLRQSIAGVPFTPRGIQSTVSIGIASAPESGKSCDALLSAAKKALFEAQRAGHNKVFAYQASPVPQEVLI